MKFTLVEIIHNKYDMHIKLNKNSSIDMYVCSNIRTNEYSRLFISAGYYLWDQFNISQNCYNMIINHDMKSAILNMNNDIGYMRVFSKLIVYSKGFYFIDDGVVNDN